MLTTHERLSLIRKRLEDAFSPTHLSLTDDSADHIGHAGAEGGAGHYTVEIASNDFAQKSKVAAHQAIYAVLGDLIPHEIHALRIQILTTQ